MPEFKRPEGGFRYDFGGMNTNNPPDALPPGKYPYASNIRSPQGQSIVTRPGQSSKFSTDGVHAVTDLRAYARLSTDNLPRILTRNSDDRVWLDNGATVGTLSGSGASPGATMLPFRPNASPTPYMYVANGSDYQKFSAPTAGNAVTMSNVGIAESATAPDACPDDWSVHNLGGAAGNWTQGGTAGAPGDITKSTDTMIALFADPASVSPSISTRYSIQVGTAVQYQVGDLVRMTKSSGGVFEAPIQAVLPPLNAQSTVVIQAITYFSGATGRCVIAPSLTPIGGGTVTFSGGNPIGAGFASQQLISGLQRGSLITLNPGGGNQEVVFVLSVTVGPQGAIAIETTTTNTHVANEAITGIPAIVVATNLASALFVGQNIAVIAVQSVIAAGTGTLVQLIAAANNPFLLRSPILAPNLPVPQNNDYVHIPILFTDLTLLTGFRIMFDVGDGSFTQNFYYYDVQPSALVAAVAGTSTQLAAAQIAAQQQATRDTLNLDLMPTINPTGERIIPDISPIGDVLGSNINPSGETTLGTSQWSQILFPITSFTRVGNDQSKTLANANAVKLQVIATGAGVTFQFGNIWVSSGQQPDVGDSGALYFYRVRPRDSRTGTVGNPSASTRYGVAPRRQAVTIVLPSAAYDSQIDTWDVFRYGGTVTSWRYVGSAASSASGYSDIAFDAAARAGDALEFDNFEPWPSVDTPQNLTATSVIGTIALVTIASPTNALRWLPGTLVQLAGGQFFTLRFRPTLVSGTTYRFEFIECAVQGTNVSVSIPEPLLARQRLPYMAGPDASGRFIGVGDPLRPGSYYYTKSNMPDSAPDSYNRELTPASELLLGVEIIDGLAFVASPERWWALYPQQNPDPTQFYNPVQAPVSRGLVAPWGHCNDGVSFYWWAKDGIYSSQKGSLTDADLFNLFPHDGVVGQSVTYAGQTVQAPDYSRCGTFRLTHANGYLYATYQDTTGTYRCLTCDLRRGAWSVDSYTPAVSATYHPEQQAGTVQASTTRYDELLFGTIDGRVATQTVSVNDLGGAISCAVAVAEFTGGDLRAPKQWGDFFLDLTPAASAGVSATPMSLGAGVAGATVITSSASRQRQPVSVGGLVVSDFLGLLVTWTDNFTLQSVTTELRAWQPAYAIQPAKAVGYRTFGTSFGIPGFKHIQRIAFAWVSTATVTITFFVVDGTAPAAIVLPSSGGAYTKQFFTLTFNKGQLYSIAAASSAPFQIFMDDTDVYVGGWMRQDPYTILHELGVANESAAVI